MFLNDKLLRAVTHIKKLHPELKRTHIANEVINSALNQNRRTSLHTILPFIEAYAFLKVRGHHPTAAFIAVFASEAGGYVARHVNRANEGASIIESSDVFKQVFQLAFDDVEIDDLWNTAIAVSELERLAAECGERSTVGKEAAKMKDCILATRSDGKGVERFDH
jgi:hypothetical protein